MKQCCKHFKKSPLCYVEKRYQVFQNIQILNIVQVQIDSSSNKHYTIVTVLCNYYKTLLFGFMMYKRTYNCVPPKVRLRRVARKVLVLQWYFFLQLTVLVKDLHYNLHKSIFNYNNSFFNRRRLTFDTSMNQFGQIV